MTAADYAYDHVSPQILFEDMRFSEDAPRPGDRLPEFDRPTDQGGRVRPADFIGRKPVLLFTGSLTCPMTASSNPGMKGLHARYGDAVEFVMLQVREAHPGENVDQSETEAAKISNVRSLRRRDALPWTIAVDDPEGSVHRRLDNKPNAAYLADRSGRIVYRSLWAADAEHLDRALAAVARGETPPEPESTRRLGPMSAGLGVMRETLEGAGPRAVHDIWRSAPPMAATAWTADLYRPLPPRGRTLAAALTLGAVIGTMAVLLSRSRR